MEKFMLGAVSTKKNESRKKARADKSPASSSRDPPALVPTSGTDIVKNIIPSSRKRKAPSGAGKAPQKTTSPDQADATLPRPDAFATHPDPSVQASYLLSIFPGNEADRWDGDSQRQARFCMAHLAALNSGLAGLLHETIEGKAPSLAEFEKLQTIHDAGVVKAEALKAELEAARKKIQELEANQVSEGVRHQEEVNVLRVELEAVKSDAANREMAARLASRDDFLTSPAGARFLKIYRKKLLNLYHDSMPFLGRLYPAAKQYLLIGATRALEQARSTGDFNGFDETALMLNLPDPNGWAGDSSLPLEFPWWESALEATMQKLKLEEAKNGPDAKVDEEESHDEDDCGTDDSNSPDAGLDQNTATEHETPTGEDT